MGWCSGKQDKSALRNGDLKNEYLVEFESNSRTDLKVEMDFVGYGMRLIFDFISINKLFKDFLMKS